jgi:hypothetical protein
MSCNRIGRRHTFGPSSIHEVQSTAVIGRDKVYTVLGPRGTAFMADTHGIHAGMVPTHVPRLILQAQYSLLPGFCVPL